ncbi:uncharacterized protein LOC111862642 isoform X3 [Cryptotermes secundus]|uniref:uncharacterized protein LOC111862642 isoform X3 n=1 Tax=Cryptotermes secundus TaxID=105785 RepID=UPI001454DB46|nr:uncharacterized protein LOC111862642 isoform X3 [Cryptotermes secundus]
MKRNVDCSQHRDAWSEENDKLIDRVYKDRMKTTYQVSYYRRYPYTGEERAAEETEDEFLKEMEICYKRSTEERLAPQVPATRPGGRGRLVSLAIDIAANQPAASKRFPGLHLLFTVH